MTYIALLWNSKSVVGACLGFQIIKRGVIFTLLLLISTLLFLFFSVESVCIFLLKDKKGSGYKKGSVKIPIKMLTAVFVC